MNRACLFLARLASLSTLLVALAFPVQQARAQSCSAANAFTQDWDAYTDRTLSVAGTTNYTVTNGASQNVTLGVSFGGDTADFAALNGRNTPSINSYMTGGFGTQKALHLGALFDSRHNNINGTNDVIAVTFTFSEPVRDLAFTMVDVDAYTTFTNGVANGQFRDWLKVTGSNGGAALTPAMSSNYGSNNTTGGQLLPGTAFFGPFAGTQPLAASEVVGNPYDTTGNSDIDQPNGNVNVSFPVPVTSVTIRYANGPLAYTNGAIGIQGISIHDLKFCTMPKISVAKTVAPASPQGSAAHFSLPGNDMVYTLTVTNSGGSQVDGSTLSLTDLLPAQTTMFTGNYSGTGASVAFTDSGSGVVCCAGVVSHGSGSPVSFGYTPNGGYDANVTGVRISPTGTMAGNSSFAVRFLVKIK